MSAEPDAGTAPWLELDQYVAAFETARAAGDAGDLCRFAPPADDPLHASVLRELVRVDLELGWDDGTHRPLAYYRTNYPELFRDPADLRAIAFEEFRLRRSAGENPDPADYEREGIDTRGWPTPTVRRVATEPTPAPKGPAYADLFIALRDSDPRAAERLAQAATAWPAPGDTFCGFRLAEELGRGAFGRVFLAYQGELADRPVALKVACDVLGEPQRMARLQHANIVPVYSVHRAEPFHAICMPYVGGTTLAEVLAKLRRGPIPPTSWPDAVGTTAIPGNYVDAVLQMAVRLADGLAHAHERGVLHRDIKPANILLADDGQPMLLDFNLAAEAATPAGAAAAYIGGTLPYMAPEALARLSDTPGPSDPRADIYALGLVVCELLTVRPPFPPRTGNLPAVLPPMIADRQSPPRVRDLNPAVSPATAAIVAKCLDPVPARRYQTARQLQDDLQRQLDDRPLKYAGEPSVWERVRKWRRRHPRLAVVLVAAAIVLPFVAAYVVRGRNLAAAEAAVTREAFGRERQLGRLLLTLPNLSASERADGMATAEAALARYGAFDGPASRPLARLEPEERSRVRREIGELMLLYSLAASPKGPHDPNQVRMLAAPHLAAEGTTPRDAFGQLAEVHDLLGRGRYREALSRLAAASRNDPRDALVWLARGDCHAAVGEFEPAVGCYHAALALAPDFYRGHFHRGVAQLQLHRPTEAIADFDTALRLKPDFLPALMQRGVARAEAGDFVAAVRDLEAVRESYGAPTQVYFMFANVLERAGRRAEAGQAKAEGLKREPGDELDANARGLARLDADPTAALADFERAEAFNPYYLPALRNQAHVLGEVLGRGADAARVLGRVLEIDPDAVADRASRGVLLARLGRRDEALTDAVEALRRDDRPFNRYQVAGIYALTSKQRPEDAREALRLLAAALEKGVGLDLIDSDRDLDPIRTRPEFAKLIAAARTLHAPVVTQPRAP